MFASEKAFFQSLSQFFYGRSTEVDSSIQATNQCTLRTRWQGIDIAAAWLADIWITVAMHPVQSLLPILHTSTTSSCKKPCSGQNLLMVYL
jgi:hypothetical protein